MYIDRDIVYADANKYLVCNNKVGFELPIDENIIEYKDNHYSISDLFLKFKNKEFGGEKVYFNKYGELTHRRDTEHHLYGDKKDD